MVCTCPDAGTVLVDEDPPYTYLPKALYECCGPCETMHAEADMFWSGGQTKEGGARHKWAWRCSACCDWFDLRQGCCLKDAQVVI